MDELNDTDAALDGLLDALELPIKEIAAFDVLDHRRVALGLGILQFGQRQNAPNSALAHESVDPVHSLQVTLVQFTRVWLAHQPEHAIGSTPDDRAIGNVCEANCTEIASTHPYGELVAHTRTEDHAGRVGVKVDADGGA